MPDITIPAAAIEAGARAAYETWRKTIIAQERDSMPADMLAECAPKWAKLPHSNRADWIEQTRAAFLATLRAWPGMWQKGSAGTFSGAVPYPAIILPLPPQENSNGK